MATSQVDAVILVGGKGTRLRPLTLSAPKPMLPTAGLPFLTHLLSRIAAAGIEHAALPQPGDPLQQLDAFAEVERGGGVAAANPDRISVPVAHNGEGWGLAGASAISPCRRAGVPRKR